MDTLYLVDSGGQYLDGTTDITRTVAIGQPSAEMIKQFTLIDVPLVEGMVLSNEPGYYRADAFGIRIENLELVVEKQTQGDFPILTFESLTRCPIDKRNINVDMLTRPELAWLNDYHQKVWDDISPLVEGLTLAIADIIERISYSYDSDYVA